MTAAPLFEKQIFVIVKFFIGDVISGHIKITRVRYKSWDSFNCRIASNYFSRSFLLRLMILRKLVEISKYVLSNRLWTGTIKQFWLHSIAINTRVLSINLYSMYLLLWSINIINKFDITKAMEMARIHVFTLTCSLINISHDIESRSCVTWLCLPR